MSIKVIIADNPLALSGLQSFLRDDPEIEIVAQVVDGMEAVLKTHSLKPDLVIMDILISGWDGIKATAIIKQIMPDVRVLIFTGKWDKCSICSALKSGADGYILKNIDAKEFCQTLKSLGRGAVILSPEVINQLIITNNSKAYELQTKLNDRELEIFRLVGQGMTNREIAQELISHEGKIKNSVSTILKKLELNRRVEIALIARITGLN